MRVMVDNGLARTVPNKGFVVAQSLNSKLALLASRGVV
jgi:hypothetical protein